MANPQQVPALSDAIALLKAGEKDKANAIMRQIVGLDPVAPAPTPAPLDPVQGARDANARNQPSAGGLINRNIKNTLTNNNLPMFNPAYAGTIDSGASLSAPPTSNPYYTTGRV